MSSLRMETETNFTITSHSVEVEIKFVSYHSFEMYYFYPLILSKIPFEFLSMLIIFAANNDYNHHNDKSLRQ